MGCIRLERISEYLCDPLKACLRDPDPYVRKTAAICVAKLFDISSELVEDRGFLDMLNELVSDSNPMVVANAVAALSEIEEVSEKEVFRITQSNLSKLLLALDVCSEWGQIFILSALSKYEPRDTREAENVCDRVVPRLNHTNAAVVLNTVKVVVVYMDYISSPEVLKTLAQKLSPPLVTLLSKESELQYVALRNINIIIQKRPGVLQGEMKIFFCKYNDPIYVKMEKLEIMIMLASERNIEQVLAELKEYSTEVDVEFVRKAVRAIGRCAIKLPKAAEKCIQALLQLIETKVNYVVQEAIVVIKDIFRKYPNQYESIIATLCDNLDTLDEPEAKASMIWIIGEYAERIENADELLEAFLENFADESAPVQLQLLTATVKLFLKRPKDTQEMVQTVLNAATQESDNPDLRDRGFIYWRLLSTDPEAAKAVVLSEKPLISDTIGQMEETLLDVLVSNISTLASVYHKPPTAFVSKMRQAAVYGGRGAEKKKRQPRQAAPEEEEGDDDEAEMRAPVGGPVGNLLDLDLDVPAASGSSGGGGGGLLDDLYGAPAAAAPVQAAPKQVALAAASGDGFQVEAVFVRRNGQAYLDATFVNQSQRPIANVAFQFNKNIFGAAPASQPQLNGPIQPGARVDCSIAIGTNGPVADVVNPQIQIAMKNDVKIYYFALNATYDVFFNEGGKVGRQEYLDLWKTIPDEKSTVLQSPLSVDAAAQKLARANVFEIARRQVDNQTLLYISAKSDPKNILFLGELTFNGAGAIKSATRTPNPELVPLWDHALFGLLRQ